MHELVKLLFLVINLIFKGNKTMADPEYNFILQSISQDKKVPTEKLEDLMDSIAMWESDINKESVIPNAIQISQGANGFVDGPGRGAFQFEMVGVGSGRNKSAKNRLTNYYKKLKRERPEWLKQLPDNFDASTLPLEQQKMLFLGDARMGPGNLSKLVTDNRGGYSNGGMSVGDWWAKHHKISGVTTEDIKDFNDRADKNRRIKREAGVLRSRRAVLIDPEDPNMMGMFQGTGEF